MSGRLLLFHYHLFLVSSLCSLALVLPDYSVSYIKATIGDTITQAKCKYPPEHHSPLSNSVESLGQAIAWAPGFYPKSPPQLNPVPSVHFTSLFWHLSLTSSGDVTAWFLSCGLFSRVFARQDDDPLNGKSVSPCAYYTPFFFQMHLCVRVYPLVLSHVAFGRGKPISNAPPFRRALTVPVQYSYSKLLVLNKILWNPSCSFLYFALFFSPSLLLLSLSVYSLETLRKFRQVFSFCISFSQCPVILSRDRLVLFFVNISRFRWNRLSDFLICWL